MQNQHLTETLLPRNQNNQILLPKPLITVTDRALSRLGESPTEENNLFTNKSSPPSWTQSPATRALRNIGAGTTEVLFGSTGSIQSCIMTLASCTIGTGVLALPAGFVEAGFAAGLSLFALSAIFNIWTCLLLVHCCIMSNRYSYRRIGVAAFGKVGGFAVKIGVTLVLFGIITALIVVFSDSIHEVAGLFVESKSAIPSKWTLSGVGIGVIILPLSLPSNISALRYTSMLALCSIAYVTIVVVVCGVKRVDQVGGLSPAINLAVNTTGSFWGPQSPSPILNIITNVPVFMMSLACQVQVPDIFHTMPRKGPRKERSLKDMTTVCFVALGIVATLYIILGFTGALAFIGNWNKLTGDVLAALSLTTTDPSLLGNISAARVVMCVSVSLTCPLLVLPCRDTVLQLLGLDEQSQQQAAQENAARKAEADMEQQQQQQPQHYRGSPIGARSSMNRISDGGNGAMALHRHELEEMDKGDKGWPCKRLISHALVTAILLASAWFLANSLSNLKLVLGFTGSTGGCMLLYILPAMFYLKLLKMEQDKKNQENEEGEKTSISCSSLLFGWIPLIVGTVVMFVATGATIYFVVDGQTDHNSTTTV